MLIHAAGTPSIGFRRAGRTTTFLFGPHPYGELGCSHCRAEEPQAFLVEVDPKDTIPTHFHRVDQFQLVVRGSGRVGRDRLGPGAVHYADRLTPYGPLEAGDVGLDYMTIRRRSDPGAGWMPKRQAELKAALSRSQRTARARRHHTVDVFGHVLDGANAAWAIPVADDDGLRIAATSVGADTPVEPLPRDGAGGYLAVLAGSVHASWDGGTVDLPAGSLLFTERATAVPAMVASSSGATLVDLQFPREDVDS